MCDSHVATITCTPRAKGPNPWNGELNVYENMIRILVKWYGLYT